MEQSVDIKTMFKNYLRELYIELSPEELPWIKGEIAKITGDSWCGVISNPRQMKGLISYYLISKNCPEYQLYSTVDLVENRFDDGEDIRDVVSSRNIVIIRHSSAGMRTKITMETLLYVVSERSYRDFPTIVVSDTIRDVGTEYIYYEHNRVMKYIPISVSNFGSSSKNRIGAATQRLHQIQAQTNSASASNIEEPVEEIKETKKRGKKNDKFLASKSTQEVSSRVCSEVHTINTGKSSRPLANLRAEKENRIDDRDRAIKDGSKDAI